MECGIYKHLGGTKICQYVWCPESLLDLYRYPLESTKENAVCLSFKPLLIIGMDEIIEKIPL